MTECTNLSSPSSFFQPYHQEMFLANHMGKYVSPYALSPEVEYTVNISG